MKPSSCQLLKTCQFQNQPACCSTISVGRSVPLARITPITEIPDRWPAAYREIGDRRAEGVALSGLANVYGYLAQYTKAIAHHAQALAIHREIGDRRGEGSDLTNMGVVFQNLGQYEKALSFYEQALAQLGLKFVVGHAPLILVELGNRVEPFIEQARAAGVYVRHGKSWKMPLTTRDCLKIILSANRTATIASKITSSAMRKSTSCPAKPIR